MTKIILYIFNFHLIDPLIMKIKKSVRPIRIYFCSLLPFNQDPILTLVNLTKQLLLKGFDLWLFWLISIKYSIFLFNLLKLRTYYYNCWTQHHKKIHQNLVVSLERLASKSNSPKLNNENFEFKVVAIGYRPNI